MENAVVCVATQNSRRPKELCRSKQLNVATKLRHNSMAEREIYFAIKSFFCHDVIEENCEENYRDNPLLYREKD